MNKKHLILGMLLSILFSFSAVRAQTAAPESIEITNPGSAGETGDFEDEEDENDPRIKLNISYQKDEEEDPFLIVKYRNWPGFDYNIASPIVEGYTPDSQRLTGTLSEDLDRTVFYHLQDYSLTVHFRLLDGRPAARDYQTVETFGNEYTVPLPYVPGYKPVRQEVKGEMPGRDVELTVFYVNENARFQ